jgi:hypothetical protein
MRARVVRTSEGEERPDVGGLRALAWARVAVGAIFLLRTTPLIGAFDPALGADAHPLLGWPEPGLSGFGIASPIALVRAGCLLRSIGLVGFMLGVRARAAGLVAVASGYFVMLQAPFSFTATQHLLLQATLLLCLADSATELSLARDPAQSPRSSIWMMRAFVASVYGWAALEKLRPDWLDGRTLDLFYHEAKLRGPLADLLLGTRSRCAAIGPAVAIGELALGPLLLVRRTRAIGLALAVGFHAGIEWMARPDVIGWVLLALLLVFVELPAQRMQRADSRGQITSP